MELEENTSRKYNYIEWKEKWRPSKVKYIVLPKNYKKFFLDIVESKELPNLLLHSVTGGTGKSSLAKALCKDLEIKYNYLNLSLERGIDTLRSNIQSFASIGTLSGKPKCVIMDEIDGATLDLQNALKVVMEEFHKSCRFILICNNISKVIEPLRQRTMVFNFDMSSKEIIEEMIPLTVRYLKALLTKENVHFEEEAIEEVAKKYYPSIRTCISVLEQFFKVYGCVTNQVLQKEDLNEEFYNLLLNKKFESCRKFIVENGIPFTEIYGMLYRGLIKKIPLNKIGTLIKILDEQQFKATNAIDPEIAVAATLIRIMEIL